MTNLSMSLKAARALDRDDPLRALRDRFLLPDGLAYFDGHSLGPLPRTAPKHVEEVIEEQWGRELIGGWNESGWIDAPQRIGTKVARLIGAQPNEVIVADSTSVNLFKLLVAASRLSSGSTLLTEQGNFHTDIYVAEGAAELTSLKLKAVPRAALEDSIGSDTNVLLLTHVHYRTAERFDMRSLTKRARDAGVLTIWDLSHSTGAVPLHLNEDGVELAVGCGYKYLNGGPGAPAFLYVAERLQQRLMSPLRGWMGHAAPFEFADFYVPARGIDRFLVGTPAILALAALECGVDSFEGVSMHSVWEKSVRLFDLFKQLMAERCPELVCISPREPDWRGSHISFSHPHAFEICQALIAQGSVGDFRAPDVIRFGLTPLYLRFEDVWTTVERCAALMVSGEWNDPKFSTRRKVT